MSGPDIIAVLKGRGLTSTVQVEPYLGQGGAGPLYGAAVTVDVYVEWKTQRVRNSLGQEVVAQAKAWARLGEGHPEGSRVTHPSGRIGYVAAREQYDGGGLDTPDHEVLALT